MARVQARTEATLERLLPSPSIAPQRLHQAMRYAVLGGGKRIRPLLAFAAGEAAAGDPQRADPARLEVLGCALECVHAYSLVHDDLPCMDDDVLRRGKPACHVEYDEAIDLASVGQTLTVPELEYMHIHKTGALIRASVALGARSAGTPAPAQLERLDHYAKCVGLAFQVVDDVLDQESSTATLGKTVGKDAANNKPTYVSALGLARAKALAEELRRDAHDALSVLGGAARRLADLADFIVLRKF